MLWMWNGLFHFCSLWLQVNVCRNVICDVMYRAELSWHTLILYWDISLKTCFSQHLWMPSKKQSLHHSASQRLRNNPTGIPVSLQAHWRIMIVYETPNSFSSFNPVQAYSPACHLNHLAFLVAVIPMYNVSYATWLDHQHYGSWKEIRIGHSPDCFFPSMYENVEQD